MGLLTLGASLGFARNAAAAENADACADAYELTQAQQKAGQLFEARKDARLCAARCPARLAKDCATWETKITAQIPSFVLHARGADGAPLAVDVQVDGAPPTYTQTGSIEAEPGPHRLLVRYGTTSVEEHVNLVAGLRNQLVELTIADSAPAVPPTAPPPDAPAPPRPEAERHTPLWRWLAGGFGVAVVAAGGGVSISGEILADQLRSSCKPNCTQAQANDVVERWIIGDTMMGIGGAVFLAALLWPESRPSRPPLGKGPDARILVGPGSISWRVTF